MSARRVLDVGMAAAAVVATAPLSLAAAVAVLLDDGPPVVFRQERVGRHGEPFTLHKFRTMREGGSRSFDAGDTRRVTRSGRWLRATKLDELPQLWDVLRGDMAMVGPRPEVPEWVVAHPDRFARVLVVRPGITDPASIEFRHEEALLAAADDPEATYRDVVLPRKLDLYERYVATRSVRGDLAILARTVAAVLGWPRRTGR